MKLQAITNAPTCKATLALNLAARIWFWPCFCFSTVWPTNLASRAALAIMKPKGKAHKAIYKPGDWSSAKAAPTGGD